MRRAVTGPAVTHARTPSRLGPCPSARTLWRGVTAVTFVALLAAGGITRLAAQVHGSANGYAPSPGGTWVRTSLALQTNALVAAPGALFAATDSGVWRSDDGGSHWTRAGLGLHITVTALALSAGGDRLFAGSIGGTVYALDTRGDRPWRRLSPSLGGNPIYSLAVASTGDTTVLAGSVGALYRSGVMRGRWRWQRVAQTGEGAVSSIAWLAGGVTRALASVFGVSPPVLASHDGGKTWQAASAGLPAPLPTQALAVLGAGRSRFVLTTMGGGVWEGSTARPWREMDTGLPQRHAMALVAAHGSGPPVLYAGTMGEGVYVKDGDAAWRRMGRGLLGVDRTVLALALASGAPATLFAGTAAGVYRYVVGS